MTSRSYRKREYAFFLSFSAFISAFFFLGIYLRLAHTAWLSILLGGTVTWLFLTLLIKCKLSPEDHPLLQRCLSLISIAYGGVTLYAFFVFSHQVIFPDHSFVFFPVAFILLTTYGAEKGIDALERTSKFTSVAITILLILTAVSTLQKIWDQREFVKHSAPDLLQFDGSSLIVQTLLITAVLLCQSLVLFQTVEQTSDAPSLLKSIRRALVPAIVLSSLLHLMAAVALGTRSFEFLTYPVYDMLSLPGYAEYLDRTEFLMLIIFLFCESCKTIAILWAGRKLFDKKNPHCA